MIGWEFPCQPKLSNTYLNVGEYLKEAGEESEQAEKGAKFENFCLLRKRHSSAISHG